MRLSTLNTWRAMINRCDSPRDARYKDYGGRGIKVCARWYDFSLFVADMGLRPAENLQLDRIDNNEGYSKENCRWVTAAENNKNKRLYTRAINNSSTITGVSYHTAKGRWRAYGGREFLYSGGDFFLACCARKSWEAKRHE